MLPEDSRGAFLKQCCPFIAVIYSIHPLQSCWSKTLRGASLIPDYCGLSDEASASLMIPDQTFLWGPCSCPCLSPLPGAFGHFVSRSPSPRRVQLPGLWHPLWPSQTPLPVSWPPRALRWDGASWHTGAAHLRVAVPSPPSSLSQWTPCPLRYGNTDLYTCSVLHSLRTPLRSSLDISQNTNYWKCSVSWLQSEWGSRCVSFISSCSLLEPGWLRADRVGLICVA